MSNQQTDAFNESQRELREEIAMKQVKVKSTETSDPTMRQWTVYGETKTMHTPIQKIVRLPNGNGKGFAILQSGGNPVYFPEDMIDFCDDWLGGINRVTNIINAHEDLVKALKAVDEHLASYVENDVDCDDAIEALKFAREAITKAGVKV